MGRIVKATKLRVGNLIILEGELYRVHSVDHRTPGKGNACMQTKLRNLASGNMVDKRFLSDVKVEKASLDNVDMEFLYEDESGFVFMNSITYEQLTLPFEIIGENKELMLPNIVVQVEFFNGTAVGIELPMNVVLKVIETEPCIKRVTASSSNKPAILETGFRTNVPSFVELGDLIKINTETGDYVTRVSSYNE